LLSIPADDVGVAVVRRPAPGPARPHARCVGRVPPGPALPGDPSVESPARAAWWDAALYGASALLAAVAVYADYIPLQRQWARVALGPYAAATAVAVLLMVRWRRQPPRRPLRTRTVLALAVLVGAALVPLTLEVGWRARHGDAFHAQSEVLLIEQGAGRSCTASTPTPSPTKADHWRAIPPPFENTSLTCPARSPSGWRAPCWDPGSLPTPGSASCSSR
jgi:hypothetical protein